MGGLPRLLIVPVYWILMVLAISVPAVGASNGPMILTVAGDIDRGGSQRPIEFDRASLERLGTSVLHTSTPWTTGTVEFEGVLLSTLLDAVGASGDMIIATALNDYIAEIPVSEARRYPLLLALRMNGEYMEVRNKGPIWLVYPWDQYPDLDLPLSMRRAVWQLQDLLIQ